MDRSRRILSMVLCTILYSAAQTSAQQYRVTDLGDFSPHSIHAGGIVLGSHNGRPAIWAQGHIAYLPDAGAGGVVAHMNSHGEMVGWVNSGSMPSHRVPAYWYQGQLHDLSYVSPGTSAWAIGINDHSDLTGELSPSPFTQGVWRQWASGVVKVHPPTKVSPESFSAGIDDTGRIWGSVFTSFGLQFAQTWEADGTITPLPTTEQEPFWSGYSRYYSVTSQGVAVGIVGDNIIPNVVKAVQVNDAYRIVLLPSLSDLLTNCGGVGINTLGQSVGWCQTGDATVRHAVLWDQEGVTDLNDLIGPTLGWVLQSAIAISNDGYIFGMGQFQGQSHNFLLTPLLPAPPSLAIHLNQAAIAPGQTLRVALEMHNPGPLLTTDVYALVLLPDGDSAVFLTNLSPTEGVVRSLSRDNPSTFPTLLAGVSWPANLHTTHQDAWVYTRTGLEANGTYLLIVAWTKPNSLQDGSIDEGDILALDQQAFQFTGPGSNLAAKPHASK